MDKHSNNTRHEEISPIKRSILSRVKLLYAIFSCIGIAIIIKIILIQVGASGEELRELGEQYSFRSERIKAARGNILSDDGRILSTSIPLYELRIDFAAPGLSDKIFNSTIGALSSSLASFFKDSNAMVYEANLRQARSKGKRYHRIAPRKVNFVELQQIEQFELINQGVRRSGFIAEQTYQRVRPLGNVAVRTIGFVNSNGVKLGIEGGFDDILRGVEGLTIKQKVSGNFWIPISNRLNIEPINGVDIQTTIDIGLQDIAQTALRERIVEVEADWGVVVIMEVETGYIKAIANITRKRDGTLLEDYNYAVGMSQEPGSTFKLPVLLALLDDAKMPLSTMIDAEKGEVMIGQAKVTDTKSGGHGRISLGRAFDVSSNIGMAKAVNAAYADDEARFVDKITSMGLGKELGLQITGEPRPTIKHPKVRSSDWDGTSLTMMSYGYAIRVTPLQTLAIYNAVANGGKLMRPLFVSALVEKGEAIKYYPPEVIIEQIASPHAIREAQNALRSVVNNGTARMLQNPQYSVAAKTGTAQIAMGRRGYTTADGSRHYLGSVVGYFPADKPKYSMIIAFKTYYKANSGTMYYGGALSAPLFRTIADRIYTSSYEFIKPHKGEERRIIIPTSGLPQEVAADSTGVPSVIGMSLKDALNRLEDSGYSVASSGKGRVVEQRLTTDTISGINEIQLKLSL